MKIKYIAICLVLLCCIIGTASAADDISTDVVSDSIDDVVITEEVDNTDSQSDDITTDLSTTDEVVNPDSQKDQSDASIETNVEEENSRATGTATVTTWGSLRSYAQASGTDYTINLNKPITIGTTDIQFGNNAIIVGNANSYITGNANGRIPFKSTNGALNITFRDVKFQNINCQMLIQLQTNGISKLENCTFINITTGTDHHSVVYNNKGTMNITGCNFTNCTTGYGVITNHNSWSIIEVSLNVKDSKFENNYALNEPGAINNCKHLTVYNCTFNKNNSTMWAGAIHTHTNADTLIVGSNFTDNIAGYNAPYPWGGGALFTYSTLIVINSTFTGNNCTAASGGGAIGGYSYVSTYNITIDSCNFTCNANNATNGYGGAIGVQNMGYLTVRNSTFINNCATNGQAISGICEDVVYCVNCTNCSCPNCTNCTHNVSTGDPYCIINNNTFINHTGSGDTVVISGSNYEFNNNIFTNSTQAVDYTHLRNQNNLINCPTSSYYPSSSSHSRLGSSILRDEENHDVIYVNVSSENDPWDELIDGQSWSNAFGGDFGLPNAFELINNNGVIYLADGSYTQLGTGAGNNITIIGSSREHTIFDTYDFNAVGAAAVYSGEHSQTTYINITFKNPTVSLRNGHIFINCTFDNPIIKTNYQLYYDWQQTPSNLKDITDSFVVNFTDCDFKNYDIADSLLEAYRYSQINFINCTFENIAANSIAKQIGGFTLQDAINFYDCTFNNVNVKGIVDVPTGTNPVERYRIEGCTGVESFGTVTADGRDFVNTTQSRTETVLVTDIDGEGNVLINLTDANGNAMAEADVLISVNGGEATPYTLGTDGTLSIALTDLTDATGKLNIAVSFEEDDDYKGSSDSIDTVLVVNTVTEVINNTIVEYVNKTLEDTSIVADALTATAKVAKTLSVTLKDASGKTIANKVITYTINGVTKTATTDANGIVKITVNQAKAGAYYYSLCFLGDNDYKASFKTVKVTVNKQATKAVFKAKTFKVKAKTKKVSFTLKDAKGKTIKGKKITVKVNGKTYTAKTNAKGVATVSLKISKKGKYTATAKFAGDTSYKAITKKAKITLK